MQPVSSVNGIAENQSAPETGSAWFSVSWLVAFLILQGIGGALYLAYLEHSSGLAPEQLQAYINGPDSTAGFVFFGWLFVFPALLLAARSIRTPWWLGLGLTRFDLKQLWVWLAILLVYLTIEGLIVHLLQIDVGEFMTQMVGKTGLALILSIVVLAPVAEELVFRGYLFGVWRNTRMGLPGTLILTSLLFSAIHWGQYGVIPLIFIFSFSVLVGVAREKTGSVWVPIILHSAANLVSVIMVNYLGWV